MTRPLVVGVIGAALLSACSADGGAGRDERGLVRFPAPPEAAAAPVSPSDFVGAEACADCHADQYGAWAGSTHGRAGGEPGPRVIIAPFAGGSIRFADATVAPRLQGGVYEFVVRQTGFPEAVFRVDGVIGGAHMIGGGTQGFVSIQPDGTERFLPWDWSESASEWFCNTGSRANQGWVPITETMRLRDCGDWPPIRPLGTVGRFANCQECHGSQILTNLAPGEGYETTFTTLQVNCESCHGPAREHVERARAAGGSTTADLRMPSLAYLGKDKSLGTCFQCHALKDVIREGYLPGDRFEEYYALKFPVLGDQPYFADGRVRSFAYQANHLASACYLDGPMDCVSCHEPHAQGYWDIDRKPLASPLDDGQCTACHASKALDTGAHTFHTEGTEASRCVSCHMPYLQHPEVGDGIPFARSDHTIAIPRPVFDADLGLESACAKCHRDTPSLELQSQVRERWGELKPHRPLVAGIVGELRARNLEEAAALLLRPEEHDPLTQFQALSRLFDSYLRPDVTALPGDVEGKLRALASGNDLDVRALALASLHWTRGDDPGVRDQLVDALSGADDDGALRGRWLLAIGYLGDRARDADDFATSRVAYRKALEIAPNDARVLLALGQMHAREGSPIEAEAAFRRSLSVDRAQPLTWVNLGIVLADKGDPLGANEAYTEALRINPYEALAHFNLGNLYRAADDLGSAAIAYGRAVAADPGLGQAHFELARTFILLDRAPEALLPARRAVELLPDHGASGAMLADLERAFGGA